MKFARITLAAVAAASLCCMSNAAESAEFNGGGAPIDDVDGEGPVGGPDEAEAGDAAAVGDPAQGPADADGDEPAADSDGDGEEE